MTRDGFSLVELVLAIALSSMVLVIVARLTRTASDEQIAWASRVEPVVETKRLLDALEEAWYLGDDPDAEERIEVLEGAIAWTQRGAGRLVLRHDVLRSELRLGRNGEQGDVVAEAASDFSATLESDGRALLLGWSQGGEPTRSIERRMVVR